MHSQNKPKKFIVAYSARLCACIVFGLILIAHFSVFALADDFSSAWVDDLAEYRDSVEDLDWSPSLLAVTYGSTNGGIFEYDCMFSTVGTPVFFVSDGTNSCQGDCRLYMLVNNSVVVVTESSLSQRNIEWDWNTYQTNINTGETQKQGKAYAGGWNFLFADSDKIDGYIFDSTSSATAFFTSGDKTGIIQEPKQPFNFNTDHNFMYDVYQSDIPVPHLSALSYTGFTVDNAQSDLYLDLYIQSEFSGVKHGSSTTRYGLGIITDGGTTVDSVSYVLDKSVFNRTHRYNAANYDLAYNDSSFVIADKYNGIDIVGDLISDFKDWSASYPSHKDLPDYSFVKHGANTWALAYDSSENYYKSASSTDYDKLVSSGLATVTYYTRFYTVRNGEVVYGKWIAYKYYPGSAGTSSLEIGDVQATSTGDPTMVNTEKGIQDSSGNFTYGLPSSGSYNVSPTDISSLREATQGFFDFVQSFPSFGEYYRAFTQFLVSTFAFIPAPIWMTIYTAFQVFLGMMVIKIILRFL